MDVASGLAPLAAEVGKEAPFWERSNFSWAVSPRQPLMMWGDP